MKLDHKLRILILFCCILPFKSEAQGGGGTPFPPPRVIKVYNIQGLAFGNFYTGSSGGTVVVTPYGTRSVTGSVMAMGGSFNQALFIIELLPGRLVQIMLGSGSTLYRNGGGGTMNVTLGPASRSNPFVTSAGHPFHNQVGIGGTLFVGNPAANPVGEYAGFFTITFIQE
ncbi:MAG TPA: DUF4402 domain-containing protein [Bacteroidales bacterium]|nr:DUF4402 domain-containing protein [Bacteroidales bacterium]HRZ48947.1 DUF4402 domain-containing protein [Bacteroidales bacterium]